VIVVHSQQQQRDAENSAQRRCGERPLVHRYAKEFENNETNRDVDENQEDFHD
jgi:hypothetical protein